MVSDAWLPGAVMQLVFMCYAWRHFDRGSITFICIWTQITVCKHEILSPSKSDNSTKQHFPLMVQLVNNFVVKRWETRSSCVLQSFIFSLEIFAFYNISLISVFTGRSSWTVKNLPLFIAFGFVDRQHCGKKYERITLSSGAVMKLASLHSPLNVKYAVFIMMAMGDILNSCPSGKCNSLWENRKKLMFHSQAKRKRCEIFLWALWVPKGSVAVVFLGSAHGWITERAQPQRALRSEPLHEVTSHFFLFKNYRTQLKHTKWQQRDTQWSQ